MHDAQREDFGRRLGAVTQRVLAQTGEAPLAPEELATIADALWTIGEEGGWACRSGSGELDRNRIRSWTERLTAALPQRAAVVGGLAKPWLKACFQPAPAVCRDSFMECSADGQCRRQDHDRARARISGAHCVDCPHWTAMTPAAHAEWLAARWHQGVDAFHVGREVFLPEDFRALRAWHPGTASETCACG